MDWLREAIRYRRDARGRKRLRPLEEQILITQVIAALLIVPLMIALGLYLLHE